MRAPAPAGAGRIAPASSVTVSITTGRCQTKSKPPARTDGRHVRLGRRRHLAPLRLRAHSGGDASNPSDAMVSRWTLSVFGVVAPSTPSVRTGHNPPIAVVGSEFLGRGIRATVVAWTRAYPVAAGRDDSRVGHRRRRGDGRALRPPADHLRRLHRRRRRGPQVRKGADVSIDQAREAHPSDADGRGTTEGGDDQE